MKWKNKLKSVLSQAAESKNSVMCLEKAMTKTDKTHTGLVSSVFVSGHLRDIPEKTITEEIPPECSNCGLQMNLIENETLWFCPLGCTKRNTRRQF